MNRLFSLLGLTFLFSSCSTYYVSKLNSPDLNKNDETGVFVFENDSVQVTYNFFGENAPVTIDVYNKLKEPLYIDWQRSALIVGDQATSYVGDNLVIKGRSLSTGSSYRTFDDWRTSLSEGAFAGTATVPQSLTFIPPHSKIKQTKLKLTNLFYENIADSSYRSVDLATIDGAMRKIKVRNYTQENTPLTLRSYLTMYVRDDKTEKTKRMVFEQNFYVNQVSKLGISPANLLSFKSKRGDTFFNKKTKGRGVALVTAAVAIGTLGYVANERNQTARSID
ncbi:MULTISPECIES: hypothetical protein [Olivibacter]|uniref:Lipoprotein n=1 Tax=Olivibacter oleidegradans TaxID=760123 RepID=A0ABV6HQ00_9SPHI|nr:MULTISPECIES: hypothetical protein [Olivibacter]MDM8173867.1 hypothetical protein [Olivibacter sp. 47]